MIRKITILTLLITTTGLTACKDNSTGADNLDLGEGSFTVSGDTEGEKEGQADFDSMESSGIYTWEISIHDYSPQSFSLTFMLMSSDPIDIPGSGTYDIGNGSSDASVFTAIYTDTEAGVTNATEYSTLFGQYGGTLTITSSSGDEVKGTFGFTAADYDHETGQARGEISLTDGEFTARKRISSQGSH